MGLGRGDILNFLLDNDKNLLLKEGFLVSRRKCTDSWSLNHFLCLQDGRCEADESSTYCSEGGLA
jgi:hypothetical protein